MLPSRRPTRSLPNPRRTLPMMLRELRTRSDEDKNRHHHHEVDIVLFKSCHMSSVMSSHTDVMLFKRKALEAC